MAERRSAMAGALAACAGVAAPVAPLAASADAAGALAGTVLEAASFLGEQPGNAQRQAAVAAAITALIRARIRVSNCMMRKYSLSLDANAAATGAMPPLPATGAFCNPF